MTNDRLYIDVKFEKISLDEFLKFSENNTQETKLPAATLIRIPKCGMTLVGVGDKQAMAETLEDVIDSNSEIWFDISEDELRDNMEVSVTTQLRVSGNIYLNFDNVGRALMTYFNAKTIFNRDFPRFAQDIVMQVAVDGQTNMVAISLPGAIGDATCEPCVFDSDKFENELQRVDINLREIPSEYNGIQFIELRLRPLGWKLINRQINNHAKDEISFNYYAIVGKSWGNLVHVDGWPDVLFGFDGATFDKNDVLISDNFVDNRAGGVHGSEEDLMGIGLALHYCDMKYISDLRYEGQTGIMRIRYSEEDKPAHINRVTSAGHISRDIDMTEECFEELLSAVRAADWKKYFSE